MSILHGGASIGQANSAKPASRIESDINIVRDMIRSIENSTERVVGHARSLGYFEPPQGNGAIAPTPVITTMSDALQALNKAILDHSGALNVFD